MSKDMRGTMFAVPRKSAMDPTHIGCVTIDGVRVNMSVYPEEISTKGNRYQAVRLRYPQGQSEQLKKFNTEN